jgi:hypothetical protein
MRKVGLFAKLIFSKMKEKKENYSEFITKVLKGVKLFSERMISTKIEKNHSLVIMRSRKTITIMASELRKG